MIYNKYVCKEFIRVTETDFTYLAIYYALFEFYNIIIVTL